MQLLSKLPDVGTTIFTVMSQLANDHNAINLGQGFPDFDPDVDLINKVNQAMMESHNQYPPMAGVPELRQEISTKVRSLYGRHYDTDTEITVTSGATEALMASILALVHQGDEVLVIEPCYDLYLPAIKLAGGTPVVIAMQPPTPNLPRYSVDWQQVRDAITKRTRLLVLNFPHNPTGINMQDSDLDALEGIVQDYGILLLGDEVYEHIVFDSQQHLSLASRPALSARSVVISSFGKTYNATGWKIGYCCAPAAMTAEIRKVHQFMVFTVNSAMQVGLARYMKDSKAHLELSNFYESKRNRLIKGLATTRFVPLQTQGSFFLLADYSAISDMPEADFARWTTINHGVGVIPISAFYRDPTATQSNHQLIRFCFAKRDETLDAAIEKLAKI